MALSALLLLLLLLPAQLPCFAQPMLFGAYYWDNRRLIKAVIEPKATPAPSPSDVSSGHNVIDVADDSNKSFILYNSSESQLMLNLPLVNEREWQAAEAILRPQPENCDGCVPGATPQSADAGRVNSIMNSFGAPRARARPAQFPWHATLMWNERWFVCSGALVSDQWVLTAANCAAGYSHVLVMLGTYRPRARVERFRTDVLNCSRIVVHPGYMKAPPRNDIALVKLPAPVKLNSFVLPVRLPSLNNFLTTYAGREAWMSGWGTNFQSFIGEYKKTGSFNSTSSLGYVAETVLTNEKCSETYGSFINSSVLCTSSDHFTSGCEGDSGAPLVVEEEGVFVLVGVFSFAASTGCSNGRPAGFTRITSFQRWIQNVTDIAPGPDVAARK